MSLNGHVPKIGYTRYEFRTLFQIYSQNVYSGLFKDFGFTEHQGRYFISFKEEAGKVPLITIEKRRLGPDRSLFVATTPGPLGAPQEIVRSEKIDAFAHKLKEEVERLRDTSRGGARKNLRIIS
jgi:hypothetical protein